MNGKIEILKDDSPLHSPGRGQVAPGSPCSTHWLWAPKAAEKQATKLQSQCQRERKKRAKATWQQYLSSEELCCVASETKLPP